MLNVFNITSYAALQESCIGSELNTEHDVYQTMLNKILQLKNYTAECRRCVY